MARKRMITPLLWEDPSFNKLSKPARLLFIGMISNADDEGYLRGDAGSLKRLVFGFDNDPVATVKGWVEEIKSLPNMHFYNKGQEEYCHFVKWHTHQKQQKDRIQASAYPLCSKCVASAKQVSTEVKVSKVKRSKKKTSKTSFATKTEGNVLNDHLKLFEAVNPSYERLYSNKTQRAAMDRMIVKHGSAKISSVIEILPKTNVEKYAPKITKPTELEDKLGKLLAFVKSAGETKGKGKKIIK